MTVLKIGILLAMAASLLWLLIRWLKGKNRGKVLSISAMSGLLALIAVSVIGHFQSEILHINLYTLGTASVLGIPGVILMVLIKMLWLL